MRPALVALAASSLALSACAESDATTPAPSEAPDTPTDAAPGVEEPASNEAAATEEASEPTQEAFTPTDAQDAMYRALSIRDPAPACADIAALTTAPVEDLQVLVDEATQPPWVGMRAAAWLLDLYPEQSQPLMQAWVVDPDKRGLAILVTKKLDTLPLPVATEVVNTALAGPMADTLAPRIAKVDSEALRSLVAD